MKVIAVIGLLCGLAVFGASVYQLAATPFDPNDVAYLLVGAGFMALFVLMYRSEK
jgi:hypothetical protein